MKALLIDDIKEFTENFSYEDINGFFDDNGGEPDGNSYIIPVAELPNKDEDFLSTLGEIVEAEEREYDQENNEAFEGERWIGFTARHTALCVKR